MYMYKNCFTAQSLILDMMETLHDLLQHHQILTKYFYYKYFFSLVLSHLTRYK